MNLHDPFASTINPSLREALLGYLHELHAPFWPGVDGLTVDMVLASYAQAAASGLVPGKSELLRHHPEWGLELDMLLTESQPPVDQVVCRSEPTAPVASIRAD